MYSAHNERSSHVWNQAYSVWALQCESLEMTNIQRWVDYSSPSYCCYCKVIGSFSLHVTLHILPSGEFLNCYSRACSENETDGSNKQTALQKCFLSFFWVLVGFFVVCLCAVDNVSVSLQGAMQSGQEWDAAVVFRQPSAGRAVTWTGHGFARVPSGAGLRFAISNVPFAMDFDITVRYEPEVLVMSCMSCGVVIGAGSILWIIGWATCPILYI